MVKPQTLSAVPVAVLFAWREVDPEHRDWLKKRTQDIESFVYRTACDIIRIGQILSEVKKRLPKKYEAWLATSTPFSAAQARRLRGTAKVFNPFLSQIESIEPSALYVLAQDNTPQAARDHAVQLATGGTRVTHAVAREILDAHKPVGAMSKESVDAVQTARNRLWREEDREQAKTEGKEEQDDGRAAKMGRIVAELVERKSMVQLAKVEDAGGEGIDGAPIYSVTTYDPQCGPRSVSDRDLNLAIQRAAGSQEYKFCAGCCVKGGEIMPEGEYAPGRQGMIPTHCFSRDRRTADLLGARCNNCERPRKREIRLRKKLAKDAATPATAEQDPPMPSLS